MLTISIYIYTRALGANSDSGSLSSFPTLPHLSSFPRHRVFPVTLLTFPVLAQSWLRPLGQVAALYTGTHYCSLNFLTVQKSEGR